MKEKLRFEVMFHYEDKSGNLTSTMHSDYFKSNDKAIQFSRQNTNVYRPSKEYKCIGVTVSPVKVVTSVVKTGVATFHEMIEV